MRQGLAVIFAILLCGLALPALAASGPKLTEPGLRLPPGPPGQTRVALTFDACEGGVDRRLLDLLETQRIPATLFVTGKWLARNGAVFQELLAHPDLFEIEDHGARHLPAISVPTRLYGLKVAGSVPAVRQEVLGGAAALETAGAPPPHWFRGAGAEYDAASMTAIASLGYRIAGFSLNGDGGATLSEAEAFRTVAAARDGDVILSHLNQPTRPSGAGVAKGIRALQARGVVFVRLSAVLSDGEALRR